MKLFRNVRAQMVATVVAGAVNILLLLALTRLLGPENFAVYGIATAVAAFALVLQDGGHKVQLFREMTAPTAQSSDPAMIMGQATGWTLVATVIALVFGVAYGYSISGVTAVAAGLAILANIGKAYAAYASAAMRARNGFQHEARAQIRRHLIVVAAVVLTVVVYPSPVAALVAGLLGQMFALWGFADRREIRWPRLAGPIVALMLIDLVTIGYSKFDQFILAATWPNMADVGRYIALTRIIDIYVFALTPLAAIFFRHARTNTDAMTLSKFARISTALSLPGVVGLPIAVFFGDDFLGLVLGRDYHELGKLLPYVALATVFLAPNFLAGQLLIARNQEREFLLCAMVTLIAKMLLSIIFIPTYGPLGCIISIIASEIILLFALMSVIVRHPRM